MLRTGQRINRIDISLAIHPKMRACQQPVNDEVSRKMTAQISFASLGCASADAI
jgi:hypothetical protein